MSNDMNDTFEQIEQIVVAGASALREALGVPVTARDVEEVPDAASGAPADGVYGKAAAPNGSVVVAASESELEAAGDVKAIVDALAQQMAAAAGATDIVSEQVDSFGAADARAVRFELTVDGTTVRVTASFGVGLLTAPAEAEEPATVTRPELPDLGVGNGNGAFGRDVTVLSDVTMKVTVQLGHTQLLVRDLLSLSEGSVVELEQAPGTPVDILVNGTAVARGDVVVVHDDLGVRITEVLGKPA